MAIFPGIQLYVRHAKKKGKNTEKKKKGKEEEGGRKRKGRGDIG